MMMHNLFNALPSDLRTRFRIARILLAACFLTGSQPKIFASPQVPAESSREFDVVIYGGNSAAIAAAVQASRMGKSVVVVSPDKHLGGLTSGGLGFTDTGNKAVIGGVAREFYHRIWKEYDQASAWRWQSREKFGNRGQGTPAIDGQQRTMWVFEPHVAERVFDQWIAQEQIHLFREELLDREKGVLKRGNRIAEIRTLSGKRFSGRIFMDTTYEGDLMAAAGVTYTIGREAIKTYGEKWNGVQVGVLHHRHHFGAVPMPISAYRVPGDPTSGILPRVSPNPPGEYGSADRRVQAYCFRMCLTNDERNRVPFPKPEGYDANEYELLLRVVQAGWREGLEKFDAIPNHKTDTNNHGPFSTDNIGMNYDYPDASYERRRQIIAEHEKYQKGLMYFLTNDPRVPKELQDHLTPWGLAADEFIDNNNWPHQLYIREARRMVGNFVMTENQLLKREPTPESIGMGSYMIDSHNVQRYITPEGLVQNEGDIGVAPAGPYPIALGSIMPKQEQCENLLVPVCLSSSHIAYGSIRMEPVFMVLGQSAATAAAIAIDSSLPVQKVPYDRLRQRLLQDGQVLEYHAPVKPDSELKNPLSKLSGIVIDDSQAKQVGHWSKSSSLPAVGDSYLHDGDTRDGAAQVVYEKALPTGKYRVRLSYSGHANRSSKVAVTVDHAKGSTELFVNQRQPAPIDKMFVELGEFEFSDTSPARVTISNRQSDGYVIADCVQFLKD